MDSDLKRWVRWVILKPWNDGWLRGTLRHLLLKLDESRPTHPENFNDFEPDLGGEA